MSRHAVARADSIHIESIGDELVVFDELTQQSHSLDAMATSVFRAADGTRSLADLATVTGLHESQVSTALAGLGAASLVSLPAELSRRALLARGAVVGGVALASPAILSVMAP